MMSSAIVTATGVAFDPLRPEPELVKLEDIAHALANQARFSGHTSPGFYSVAQHSFLVALHLADEHKRWGLLHDAAEAYLGDLASPLKHHTELGNAYREIESGVMTAIAERFSLQLPEPEAVRQVDHVVLATEVRDLMPESHLWSEWVYADPLHDEIVPWPSEDARRTFIWTAQLLEIA